LTQSYEFYLRIIANCLLKRFRASVCGFCSRRREHKGDGGDADF